MKPLVYILFLSWISTNIFAEGTKQLRPTSADFGNVEINDQGRPFALESNTDTLHRLYVHINNTSEKIYFGFQPENKTLGTGTFRIKNSSGTIVYARTSIPVATGAGYIETYNEAVAGPKIGGSPSGGYTPLSYTPTTTGDFYFEFTTTLGAAVTYHFDLFDITVVNASNQPIEGRMWSYAWDFSTRGSTNEFNATMFVYTSDKYTTSVDFNGMRPWGFVISCNSKGTQNTGNPLVDRQSVNGNSTYPEYKVFLTQPDANVYPAATTPTMIEDLAVVGSPITGSSVKFYLNMSKSGLVEIFLDLDGIIGYQPGNLDVVLVKNIVAGGDTIIWDGKDFAGTFVTQNVSVGVTSRFSTGVTHLPIYDDEFHDFGYIVNRVTPTAVRAPVYWDDSKLGGTVNLLGASGDTDGHNFKDTTNGYGNLRTMNTWWNGFENDDLKSFTFTMDGTFLPICLVTFKAYTQENEILIVWKTKSERNNDYFEIEKSINAYNWETIAYIDGEGNSNKEVLYNYIDENPYIGTAFYRLKQIDYDGKYEYSNIISIRYTETNLKTISISPIPSQGDISINSVSEPINSFDIISMVGNSCIGIVETVYITNSIIRVNLSQLDKGTYIARVNEKTYFIVKN